MENGTKHSSLFAYSKRRNVNALHLVRGRKTFRELEQNVFHYFSLRCHTE